MGLFIPSRSPREARYQRRGTITDKVPVGDGASDSGVPGSELVKHPDSVVDSGEGLVVDGADFVGEVVLAEWSDAAGDECPGGDAESCMGGGEGD